MLRSGTVPLLRISQGIIMYSGVGQAVRRQTWIITALVLFPRMEWNGVVLRVALLRAGGRHLMPVIMRGRLVIGTRYFLASNHLSRFWALKVSLFPHSVLYKHVGTLVGTCTLL